MYTMVSCHMRYVTYNYWYIGISLVFSDQEVNNSNLPIACCNMYRLITILEQGEREIQI